MPSHKVEALGADWGGQARSGGKERVTLYQKGPEEEGREQKVRPQERMVLL